MITDDNKKKISDTLNNLYTNNFRTPIFNILTTFSEWFNNTDEFEKKAIAEKVRNGKVFCDCPFLNNTVEHNISYTLLSCGRIEFDISVKGDYVYSITWDNELGFMHFPSFETLAGRGTRLVHGFHYEDGVDNFVNAHFTCENGRLASDLVSVKKVLEQDFSALFESLANIVKGIIQEISCRADEIEMEVNNGELELRKAFGLNCEEPKRKFVKIEISVERV